MEQPHSGLKLFGSWASSYTHRVQLALKLKGLDFEYVEEDVTNKSPSLLLHNPVYKKVPVLLHLDRPIVESIIILQYIDETWTDNPIMPDDPYERALARFWCHFADDKVQFWPISYSILRQLIVLISILIFISSLRLCMAMHLGPAVGAVFGSSGEEKKAAVGQVHEYLELIETELREGAFKGRRFFGGDRIGILDIVLGCGSYWLAVFDEVMEVKIVGPEAFPLFHAWLREFEEQKEVKDIIPAIDKLLEYARGVRQMMLSLKDNTSPPTAATVTTASATTTAAAAATTTTVATTNNSNNVVVQSGNSV